MFIACGMIDDLLEYCDGEEDPFSAQRYVEALREVSPRSSGPPSHQNSCTLSFNDGLSLLPRATPQMGINALKKSPEILMKSLKRGESRDDQVSSKSPINVGGQNLKGLGKLDLHMPRRHKRTPSESPAEPSKGDDKIFVSHQLDEEKPINANNNREKNATSPRETDSPVNEKKIIGFLKSRMPFSALQNLSPSHRQRQDSNAHGGPFLESSGPSSPNLTYMQDKKYQTHSRNHSDYGRRFSAFQSAPPSPSKALNRHSAEITCRPQFIMTEGEDFDEDFWKI